MTKETFLYGYGPLSVIKDKLNNRCSLSRCGVDHGVLYHNRRDVLDWALKEQNTKNIGNNL